MSKSTHFSGQPINGNTLMAKNTQHLAAPHGLGMAWIGKKAAERWDSHNNNQELQQNLSIAQEMEIQDIDLLTIKMATGWERGADMGRYEVPDFFWKQKVLNQAYIYGMATPFSALTKDGRLLTMYPELKNYKLFVKLLPQGATTAVSAHYSSTAIQFRS